MSTRLGGKEMKKLFAFLLALVMVLSLAACGGNSGQDTSGSAPAQSGSGSSGGSDSAAPAKLTLILRAGTYADVIKECLPAFEAENNVTCEVQELSESDLYSGIALDAINSAGTYDLCMVDGSWMAEFTDSGVLANLTELGYALDDDVIPATTSICYVDGQLYLAPRDTQDLRKRPGRRQEGLHLPRRQPEQPGGGFPAHPAVLWRLGH